MLEFPRALFLVLHTLLLYINDLPDDAICDIYVNDATLYSKCDEASDQNQLILDLNMIYETLWTGAGCGLLISVLEKPN